MKKLISTIEIVDNGKFSGYLDLGELEKLLNDSFGVRDMELVRGYFDKNSPSYPSGVSFLVLTQDIAQEGSPLAGILLAETKGIHGFNFDYYDKIAVHPDYQKDGVMTNLVQIARNIGDQDGQIPPALLRTSDAEISKSYDKLSDVVVKMGDYYIHGYGFFNDDGNPLLDDVLGKFQSAAKYAAALPATLVKKQHNY